MTTQDIHLGYIAGMIDGDGSVAVLKRGSKEKPRYRPFVQVGGHCYELMEYLVQKMGGGIANTRPACLNSCDLNHVHNRAQSYQWHATEVRCILVLQAIVPYMIEKQRKAIDMLTWYYSRPHRHTKLTQSVYDDLAKRNWPLAPPDDNHVLGQWKLIRRDER